LAVFGSILCANGSAFESTIIVMIDHLSSTTQVFVDEPAYMAVNGNRIAYRIVGEGHPLVFITGWPFHSYTYSQVIPYLVKHFRCILLDSPGLGRTEWSQATDFTFRGQAQVFHKFLTLLGLDSYSMIAHNTGATIARLLAAADTSRLHRFVILNTEIPGERPPWFPLYAKLMRLPGSHLIFRLLLSSKTFLKSMMGFGGCYADPSRLNDHFIEQYVRPLLDNPKRLYGAMRYLSIGLDFKLIDCLSDVHAGIKAPVHFIWGNADPTFPIDAARGMLNDFPLSATMTEIEGGKLLAHEEYPERVATAALNFLASQIAGSTTP
jgi:haloalkane dehalogenase